MVSHQPHILREREREYTDLEKERCNPNSSNFKCSRSLERKTERSRTITERERWDSQL